MSSNNGVPAIDKLIGRENFCTWKFAVKTYLEHEELLDCILGTEKDAKKISKAKTKIILLLDPSNYVHIQDCENAKQVWDKLVATFEDSGLCRRVCLLRALITTRLEDCGSMEEYVNTIISTTQKLNGIKFNVPDDWIGTLLLAGLPEHYSPMIMGIESSGKAITGDVIKTKLLQDVKSASSNVNVKGIKRRRIRRQNLKRQQVRQVHTMQRSLLFVLFTQAVYQIEIIGLLIQERQLIIHRGMIGWRLNSHLKLMQSP